MASRSDGVTRLYEAPQAPEPERLPQPTKTKDKVLLDERGLLDLPFLALTVLLVLIGVVMVFSASYARAYYLTGNSTYYFARQAIFAVVGIGGMLFVSRLNYQLWRSASFIILAVSVVFLMLVPLIGSTANGAKRWIEVAGIRFQPSELAKIAIIMTFSAMISTYRDKMRTFRYGIAPFGAIMIVLCGLVALERHFSCILIMLLLAAAMLFLGGVQIKWFALGGAAVAMFMFVYLKTQGYAGSRITAWRDPASDPTDNGYQILQSLYAIGSGGLMGLGLGKSCQKYLYLPEEHNDYIFPILCEELGFVRRWRSCQRTTVRWSPSQPNRTPQGSPTSRFGRLPHPVPHHQGWSRGTGSARGRHPRPHRRPDVPWLRHRLHRNWPSFSGLPLPRSPAPVPDQTFLPSWRKAA